MWDKWGFTNFNLSRPITRVELAVLIDKTIDPFSNIPINHEGKII